MIALPLTREEAAALLRQAAAKKDPSLRALARDGLRMLGRGPRRPRRVRGTS